MQGQQSGSFVDANVKLSFGKRLAYSVSEYGYNSTYYWISAFLMFFYTDKIGIPAGSIAGLFLVVRLLDGFIDPFIGSFIDRTHTRWGRYRPWIFIGYLIMPITIVLLFSANPGWSLGAKTTYLYIFYIAAVIFSSIGNMSYGAMNSVMTSNSGERTKLSGLRMLFANLGNLVTGLVAMPLVLHYGHGQATTQGYLYAVLTMAAIALPTLLVTPLTCKELLTPPPTQKTLPFKKQVASLFKNQPMLIVLLGIFTTGFTGYGRMAILMYYFTYVGNNPKLMSTFAIVNGVAGMIGAAFVSPWMYSKTKHKGRSTMILLGASAFFYLLMFFFRAPNPLFFVMTFFASMAASASGANIYGTMPDAIDYGEYKTGIRSDAFLSSFSSFAMTAGGAIAPSIAAAVLASMHYQPNVAQTPQVVSALNFMATLAPAALYVIAVLVYSRYRISADKHEVIRLELERRRKNPETEMVVENIF